MRIDFDFEKGDAELIKSAATHNKRSVRNFVMWAAVQYARSLANESHYAQQQTVLRAIQSGASTAEDVRLMTGMDKPTILLTLNELEALNALRSEIGKGNRTTVWFPTYRAPARPKPVLNEDF